MAARTRYLLAAMLLGLAALANSATAGAWPRDPDRAFIALSQEISLTDGQPFNGFAGLYMEQGLAGRLTVGLDIGKSTGQPGRGWQALYFLRVPLRPVGATKLAWSAALGLVGETGHHLRGARPVLRGGLHLGRGMTTPLGPGWLAVDASAQHAFEAGSTVWKLDATLGVRPATGRMWFVQLQANRYPGKQISWRLVPTHVLQLAPRLNLEVGLVMDTRTPRVTALKIGTWIEF